MNLLWIIFVAVLITADSNELAAAVAIENALLQPEPTIEEVYEAKKKAQKEKFEQELIKILSTENSIKNFEMTSNDPIEKRAINRAQIDYLIDILSNQKKNAKNYYNYRNSFRVKTLNDVKYLYSVQTEKEKESYPNGGAYCCP
jgi:hypothetical protein